MSSLQDTPQQALAGWLHQRGGENAVEKMTDELGVSVMFLDQMMDPTTGLGEYLSVTLSIALAVYTEGEVVFRLCPQWVVDKVLNLKANGDAHLTGSLVRLNADLLSRFRMLLRYERSWLFKLWRFFHG